MFSWSCFFRILNKTEKLQKRGRTCNFCTFLTYSKKLRRTLTFPGFSLIPRTLPTLGPFEATISLSRSIKPVHRPNFWSDGAVKNHRFDLGSTFEPCQIYQSIALRERMRMRISVGRTCQVLKEERDRGLVVVLPTRKQLLRSSSVARPVGCNRTAKKRGQVCLHVSLPFPVPTL